MNNISNLQDWLFHFNIYNDTWEAVKRDHIMELFSDRQSPFILRSKSINTLQEIIIKYNGDTSKIPL